MFTNIFASVLLASAVSMAADMPYQDETFGCIDQSKASRYTKEYNINVQSFGGNELCNSKVDTKKLFNDLQILEDGQFSNSGSNNLVKGFVAADKYYSWMRGQTRGIERGNDIPYATAYNSWGYFTMQDGWASLSTLGRVGTVVHEARHTAGYRHYACDQGPYQSSSLPGCDENYSQGGSHAVEMEYYARVSVQGTNFHPVYKSMARLMAMARANFVFNEPVMKKREALLAVDASNKAHLFDKGQWFERETPVTKGALKRTSFGAVLFDGAQAQTIEMYEKTGHNPTLRDDYSYFKLLGNRGGPWKDFEEFDLGIRRFVVATNSNDQLSIYNFPEGNWGSLISAGMKVDRMATLLENGEEGFFLVSEQGDIVPFNPTNGRMGPAKNFKWGQDVAAMAKMDGKVLSLRADGQVYESSAGQWTPWSAAQGQKFVSMVNVPVYDAFEVKK